MCDYWKDAGEYYGYPKCCIEHFCSNIIKTDEQKIVAKSQGFIPCPDCTKRILDGEIKLEDLIKDRKCEFPFPYTNKNNQM